jgi:hypothetical protein
VQPGDYVTTRRRIPPRIRRGVRGTVQSLVGDWATVELPEGGRFESHVDNLTRLVRKRECASLPEA